jgi:hypothetical protein
MSTRKAFHRNAPGDFYVEDQCCIVCRAPEQQAPELMSHDSGKYEHCYFKRQPQTPEETEHAIMAVRVGCCGAVRYGGSDPAIIARLSKYRSKEACDNA